MARREWQDALPAVTRCPRCEGGIESEPRVTLGLPSKWGSGGGERPSGVVSIMGVSWLSRATRASRSPRSLTAGVGEAMLDAP